MRKVVVASTDAVFFIKYSLFYSEKSIKRDILPSGDLAIFAFVSAVLSKQFAGGPRHANLEFMQLCDMICM